MNTLTPKKKKIEKERIGMAQPKREKGWPQFLEPKWQRSLMNGGR